MMVYNVYNMSYKVHLLNNMQLQCSCILAVQATTYLRAHIILCYYFIFHPIWIQFVTGGAHKY